MNFDDCEPLPVFDCIFCAQEHYVLFKYNEQILINKFASTSIASGDLNRTYLIV